MSENFDTTDIEKELGILDQEIEDVSRAIEFSHEVIEGATSSIAELSVHKCNLSYTRDIYKDMLTNCTLVPLGNDPIFIPLHMQTSFAPTYSSIRSDIEKGLEHCVDNSENLIAATPVSGSASYTAFSVSRAYPQYFPNSKKIFDKYKPQFQVNENIAFIKSQLAKQFPAVLPDFQRFLDNMSAFDITTSAFIEFIGLRSVFFHKLVFAQNSHLQTYDAIMAFVYGKRKSIDLSAQNIVSFSFEVWNELSSQDFSGMSVKLGNTDVEYLKTLYRRVIGMTASLLRARSKFFV